MKTKNSLPVAFCALVFALVPAREAAAQMMNPDSTRMMGGLLGETYSGVEIGYARRHENAPKVMHRYGFMASRPMPDWRDVDGRFRYNYTRGSTLGTNGSQSDFAIGLAGFRRYGPVAPFLDANIGWAWAKADGARDNSFLYQARTGAEIMLSPTASLTPSVSYQQTPMFRDEHVWHFGAKAAFRLNTRISATFALQIDDKRNVETILGVQRRF